MFEIEIKDVPFKHAKTYSTDKYLDFIILYCCCCLLSATWWALPAGCELLDAGDCTHSPKNKKQNRSWTKSASLVCYIFTDVHCIEGFAWMIFVYWEDWLFRQVWSDIVQWKISIIDICVWRGCPAQLRLVVPIHPPSRDLATSLNPSICRSKVRQTWRVSPFDMASACNFIPGTKYYSSLKKTNCLLESYSLYSLFVWFLCGWICYLGQVFHWGSCGPSNHSWENENFRRSLAIR